MEINQQTIQNIQYFISDYNEIDKETEDLNEGQFRGLFIAKGIISNLNNIELEIMKGNYKLSDYDKKEIENWLSFKEKKEYSNTFYRLDLETYILIFQMHINFKERLLLGHFLEKNLESRLILLELRQQYLEEKIESRR